MFKGFKEFILRGNVIELAVAVVIGAAFTAVVNSIVTNLINPLIGAIFRADSLDTAFIVAIPTVDGGESKLAFGAIIGAIISFLVVALVVYFVFVLPMNTLKERTEAKRKAGEPATAEEPEDELALLAQIRDLLAANNTASGKHSE
ncbi:large conductance mechanosensitive channel protein MscL [Agromyces protaetiae]|uniref:Large-conductance mechanosensitive channel n=1 Tax=Agromyces protaetiae TaxID=2509455 RepID=A0A4P6FS34_9MICO|nr:large conductance mechanosensitive channel protein MscL [Agromyces protaetiae]QAY73348.1 large conductance mechanosensitive channel protein MscL [Agromyces protaetiae]